MLNLDVILFLGDRQSVRMFGKDEWQAVCAYVCLCATSLMGLAVKLFMQTETDSNLSASLTLLHLNSLQYLTAISICYIHLPVGRCVDQRWEWRYFAIAVLQADLCLHML